MSARVLRFEKSASPLAWGKLYEREPRLAQASYAEQLRAYCEDLSSYAGAMARYLEPKGYEVMEVYTDIQPLQRAWAREHDVTWNPATWLKSIPLAQAKWFRPDVVYSYDSRNLDFAFLRNLKAECASVKAITGFICSPSFDVPTFREYDVVLTCTNEYMEGFVRDGLKVEFMRHVFDPYVLTRLVGDCAAQHDVVFSGAVWRSAGGHGQREEVLEALARMPNAEMYSAQASLSDTGDLVDTFLRRGVYAVHRAMAAVGLPRPVRRRLPLIGKAATWSEWPMRQVSKNIRAKARPPVFGLDMFQLLHDSKVAVNCTATREAANMRLYEATGVGSCLLTDYRENLGSIFELDSEVVAYDSPEDCVEKARWLLDHPKERAEIAAAGQRRTLRDYTFGHRAEFLDDLFKSMLAGKR